MYNSIYPLYEDSREAGFDCDYVVEGESEGEVMKRGVEHLFKDHGMKEDNITPGISKSISKSSYETY